jgi:hypothetical protein
MAVAAGTSTDTALPIVTRHKHRPAVSSRAAALHLATGLERAPLGSLLRLKTKSSAQSIARIGSPRWVKVKNPKALAVKREAEEDWGGKKRPARGWIPVRRTHDEPS